MKRIALILSGDYPVPAVKGGAIEELVTILMDQNEIEKKVEFVIFSIENDEAKALSKNYKYSTVVYLPHDSVGDRVINRMNRAMGSMNGKFLIDIGYYRKGFDYLMKHPVDAVVAEGGKYQELRRFAQEFGKDNVYLHIHHHLLCEPYIDGIYGHAIGISEFAKNEWLRTTTDHEVKPHVVYNCVNEDKFTKRISEEERAELRKSLGFDKEKRNKDDNDIVVVFCGRIQEVKGVRELMQAVVACEDERIKLLVIGAAGSGGNTTTPYVEEVQKLVDANPDRIRFTGYIDNKELYKYYQAADLQVVPSLWEEAAGLITIEGMLSGLPLIVTKSGGMIEYAPEDVAMWVDRENVVENLKGAITKLTEDENLRSEMSKKSLEQAKKFPKKKFYEDYIELF